MTPPADIPRFDPFAEDQKRKLEADLLSASILRTMSITEMMDAKVAAAEARTDTKFSDMNGQLQQLASTEAVQVMGTSIKAHIWGAAATIVGILIAAIAWGGDRFDAGLSLADQRQVQLQRDEEQDAAVSTIEGKIDQLITEKDGGAPAN